MLLLQLLWHLLGGQQESALLQMPLHGFHGCHVWCSSVLRLLLRLLLWMLLHLLLRLLLRHIPHPKAGASTGSRMLLHRGGCIANPQCRNGAEALAG